MLDTFEQRKNDTEHGNVLSASLQSRVVVVAIALT
jgi:hypothetical protein